MAQHKIQFLFSFLNLFFGIIYSTVLRLNKLDIGGFEISRIKLNMYLSSSHNDKLHIAAIFFFVCY